ncbi:uncharacterized protein L969DRAFT_74383 [Mixia osmundae IAM 14324]|uniref:Uncharacterized protein n=1 Tax=Mixia osmundae (strain CBS 9802 / IAM 14324 / JCM 22182 / KY 12970) TaxID=764103 RepID=G7E3C8_MIXOS|nr:uncharacterized protein L969DRAFT_74383 [Mixia osmundae IAM 14324]KEI39324.1 hypothetical protein L969DRAFT_74383 [Mixia osmundae IAM 14324]GAA97338.1 hypothetical protein E5Q_04016 [Mixia osmundae IAM 14324]
MPAKVTAFDPDNDTAKPLTVPEPAAANSSKPEAHQPVKDDGQPEAFPERLAALAAAKERKRVKRQAKKQRLREERIAASSESVPHASPVQDAAAPANAGSRKSKARKPRQAVEIAHSSSDVDDTDGDGSEVTKVNSADLPIVNLSKLASSSWADETALASADQDKAQQQKAAVLPSTAQAKRSARRAGDVAKTSPHAEAAPRRQFARDGRLLSESLRAIGNYRDEHATDAGASSSAARTSSPIVHKSISTPAPVPVPAPQTRAGVQSTESSKPVAKAPKVKQVKAQPTNVPAVPSQLRIVRSAVSVSQADVGPWRHDKFQDESTSATSLNAPPSKQPIRVSLGQSTARKPFTTVGPSNVAVQTLPQSRAASRASVQIQTDPGRHAGDKNEQEMNSAQAVPRGDRETLELEKRIGRLSTDEGIFDGRRESSTSSKPYYSGESRALSTPGGLSVATPELLAYPAQYGPAYYYPDDGSKHYMPQAFDMYGYPIMQGPHMMQLPNYYPQPDYSPVNTPPPHFSPGRYPPYGVDYHNERQMQRIDNAGGLESRGMPGFAPHQVDSYQPYMYYQQPPTMYAYPSHPPLQSKDQAQISRPENRAYSDPAILSYVKPNDRYKP